ncbi:hypothetical protein MTBSS4_540006 [Magnetospirillum sp. SS-4]|nr:hypothetical protein MTBSS4_540006 [Magnetospirillum sp. SS-4]
MGYQCYCLRARYKSPLNIKGDLIYFYSTNPA